MAKPENDVIRKIRKLLRMADQSRGASAGEVDNALRLVDKLMRENNLSMSEVGAQAETEKIDVEVGEARTIKAGRNWHRILAVAIADLCECVCLRDKRSGERWMAFKFVGTKHDVQLAREIFDTFLFEIELAARRYPGGPDRRSYCEGFAITIAKRVADIENERLAETGALVFVGKKKQAVDQHLKEGGYKEDDGLRMREQKATSFYHGVLDAMRAELKPKKKLEEVANG